MSKKKHIMYPFMSLWYFYGDRHIIKHSGHMGVLCPKCYAGTVLKGHLKYNVAPAENKYGDELFLFVKPKIAITCPECGKTVFVDSFIDPNILPILTTLNRKGYITEFSCEGHAERVEDCFGRSVAYIRFKHPEQRVILENYPITSPWEDGSERNVIIDEEGIIEQIFSIDCPDTSTTIRERMAALRRWANSLPSWDNFMKQQSCNA